MNLFSILISYIGNVNVYEVDVYATHSFKSCVYINLRIIL
jgi:hypothetical protein